MLLDTQRLSNLITELPEKPDEYLQDRFRREIISFEDSPDEKRSSFVAFVLEKICQFTTPISSWYRGSNVAASWTRRSITGEAVRPSHLWLSGNDATLPVFIDNNKRVGLGKGKRACSNVLQWLRQGKEQLALVTNGNQWRIVFAGLDYEAFCEWDIDLWFTEGQPSEELLGLIALLSPEKWTPSEKDKACPFLEAINDSRKGQSDLSQVLGERVRQAAEILIQAHGSVFNENLDSIANHDIYRAAVHMIMRLVVILFAESRDGLLPADNPIYHNSYSLEGLRELLERQGKNRLANSYSAWPRILALVGLIYHGCSHEALLVPSYGGELFAPGEEDSDDGMKKALYLLEGACFKGDIINDLQVNEILELLTRTKIKIRHGRSGTWMNAPVDFSCLDSEYIGILYEGLLDFELRQAPEDAPIVFLAIGNQPALPLVTLEGMGDRAIKNLLEKMKDTSSSDEPEDEAESAEDETSQEDAEQTDDEDIEEVEDDDSHQQENSDDVRYTMQARAETWARKACEIGKLVRKPRGRSPEAQMQYERKLASKARQLIVRTILPGEWFLVRWGGTRKGSGTFYTKPQLAVPTAHRTLQPLAYNPPLIDGKPNEDAPAAEWKPKKPEEILSLKVCDPACGSGSFCLAALRFLTEALFKSLRIHERIKEYAGESILQLVYGDDGQELLAEEKLPCRPDDDNFELRTKAILRRYIVERCIYGVDLDPLAVELARLSMWIETLDKNLPLTFLNHKVKCGNSLVGAWFDQFMHYPAMAWNREGGDKTHNNGIHFEKGKWTKAIKEKFIEVKADLIPFIDGATLLYPVDLTTVKTGHDEAEKALEEIHSLGITDVQQRAEKYNDLLGNEEFKKLKDAFNLWCAIWFWPAEETALAPIASSFAEGNLSNAVLDIACKVATERRFFHWELEFPDVFNVNSEGFDAILGNPPWDTSKPNSKEFFSAHDPMYRSYGKQEAVNKQKEYFQQDDSIEYHWLDYNAYFKAMSNWTKFAGFPFGYREFSNPVIEPVNDLKLSGSCGNSITRHKSWKLKREETSGYADADHAFRYQGGGDINLYKMFLEQAHALLKQDGRFGLIVPSGVYSDHGTGPLRSLFLDKCRWQWLFGFENREGIFDIHRSYKFNPVIIQKGDQTEAIRIAFMRRSLSDWENAEQFFTEYSKAQIVQFSPKSKAILEIRSARDLEVLTKIYSNSVLLGDDSEDGWGIRYATEFHMTNDSKLFPPRAKWEEWGYRPDEYSRWINGPWKPIDSLLAKLGVNPLQDGETRCAQPPYDKLPIPRADIPTGIILSREADAWIKEDEIPEVTFMDANGRPLKIKIGTGKKKKEIEVKGQAIALPLYEGRMISQFDFSEKGWVSGTGRSAEWREIPWDNKQIEPQYLMSEAVCFMNIQPGLKLPIMNIGSATNQRTVYASLITNSPCNHSLNPMRCRNAVELFGLNPVLNSFIFDSQVRLRLTGLNISFFILDETAVIPPDTNLADISRISIKLNLPSHNFAPYWIKVIGKTSEFTWHNNWALSQQERYRLRAISESLVAALQGLNSEDYGFLVKQCDIPSRNLSDESKKDLDPKGFWRIDKGKHPEHRLTVLSYVAFCNLQEKIEECGSDVGKGIEAFCKQNDGEGWMLPETLRLADYGLGHDERAKEHQPVRECFGPRFYDWQLAQSPEESWEECHLHARNLLGEKGYKRLLAELEGKEIEEDKETAKPTEENPVPPGMLFDDGKDNMPLFDRKGR